jgi:hypothetical protein
MVSMGNIQVSLDVVGQLIPEVAMVMAAYDVLKNIWLKINPGKTEEDFRAYLNTVSTTNVDDTAAYLTAQGYVEQADGSWKKPV